MGFVCVAILFYIVYLGKMVRGKWLNLLSIFSGIYAILTFFPTLCLFGLYKASIKTYCVVGLGVISFMLGYLLIIALYKKNSSMSDSLKAVNKYYNNTRVQKSYEIRMLIVKVALIIIVIFTLYRFYQALRLLRGGITFNRLRALYFNDEDYGRSRLQVYFFAPLLRVLTFISIIMYFDDKTRIPYKRKLRLLIIVFACIVLLMITNGGRSALLYALLALLFYYYKSRKNNLVIENWQLTKFQKRIIRAVVLLTLLGILVMTFNRARSGDSYLKILIRTIYMYSSGWLPNLSIRLDMLEDTDFTNGFAFIMGFIKLPAAFLHRILKISSSNSYRMAEGITSSLQVRKYISDTSTFNAYVSLFYYFFRDFGFFGVALESAIFGGFCASKEVKFEKRGTIYDSFMYLFAFYLIVSSMVRWQLVHPISAMMVYYIPAFFKRVKAIKEHQY